MKTNRLQLNHAKTEIIWFSSTRRQHQIPSWPIRIGSTFVQSVISVWDLGVHLDSDVTTTTHLTAAVRSCCAALRKLRSVRRSLPRHALLTLMRTLVVSKLDYCNVVLTGVAGNHFDRLQSVLTLPLVLVFSARRHVHITPLLRELHWLRVLERIQFIPVMCTRVPLLVQYGGRPGYSGTRGTVELFIYFLTYLVICSYFCCVLSAMLTSLF
jgi:hypothetical protein